jgi:hypothetical protein
MIGDKFKDTVVELPKLRDYCLSAEHPRGRHKARLFRSRLGLTARDADILLDALVAAVWTHPEKMISARSDEYGERIILDFEMSTAAGGAIVRSAWIIPADKPVLRFVSCYIFA